MFHKFVAFLCDLTFCRSLDYCDCYVCISGRGFPVFPSNSLLVPFRTNSCLPSKWPRAWTDFYFNLSAHNPCSVQMWVGFYTHPWSSLGFGFLTGNFFPSSWHFAVTKIPCPFLGWVGRAYLVPFSWTGWPSEFLGFVYGYVIPALTSCGPKSILIISSYALFPSS